MAKATGCLVASVDYRLAPEHKFPSGLNDCYAAAQKLLEKPGLLGVERDQITLIGDSAGGNLAAARFADGEGIAEGSCRQGRF